MMHFGSRRRVAILLTCCMSLFIAGLDNTIVNVALPAIGRDFHASLSGLQWTVDAYTVVLAGLLMFSGSMADRFGRRRIFQTGLVLFTLGSTACGLAPSLGWLVAFRMLQALGGSMLNPVAMGIIRNTFHDPKERAQAIGIWGSVVGVSIALGPVIGGALVHAVGWRWVFWVNIPVGLLVLALTFRIVPESRAEHPRRFDPAGQVLVMAMLLSLTYGIIEGPSTGWGSAEILCLFGVTVVSFVGIVFYESRRVEPLIDPRFFRSIPFSGATLIALISFAGFAGFLFLNTLYLQQGRGLSPLDAGLYTLPMATMMLVTSPVCGFMVGRYGPRPPLLIAGVLLTSGAILLTRLTTTTPFWYLVVAYLIFGAGFGFVNAPITNTAVSGMPPAQAGVAAAIASTCRTAGQTIGVAVVGAVAAVGIGSSPAAFVQASRPGWLAILACCLAVLVLAWATTSPRAGRSAARAAALLLDEPQLQTGPLAVEGSAASGS